MSAFHPLLPLARLVIWSVGADLGEKADMVERLNADAAVRHISALREQNRVILGVDGFRCLPGGYIASLDLILDLSPRPLSASQSATEAERFVIANAHDDVTFEITS